MLGHQAMSLGTVSSMRWKAMEVLQKERALPAKESKAKEKLLVEKAKLLRKLKEMFLFFKTMTLRPLSTLSKQRLHSMSVPAMNVLLLKKSWPTCRLI